jgi:hypothetical protein
MNPTTIDEAITLAKQVVEDAKTAKTQVCFMVFTSPRAIREKRERVKERERERERERGRGRGRGRGRDGGGAGDREAET